VLLHCSISAHNPARVAGFLAHIWQQGEAYPFPPVAGGWVALAGDDRGTLIEVYPFCTDMVPAETATAFVSNPAASEHSPSHQAIVTALSEHDVIALAEREGWRALHCNRGPFEVIEVWLENRILVEVLTEEMQQQYLAFVTPDNWRLYLQEQGVPGNGEAVSIRHQD